MRSKHGTGARPRRRPLAHFSTVPIVSASEWADAYRKHAPALHELCLLRVGDPATAQDLVHDAFVDGLIAWRAGRTVTPSSIAHTIRTRADRFRPPRDLVDHLPAEIAIDDPTERVESRELLRLMCRFLPRSLTPGEWSVLGASAQGWTDTELSVRTHRSVGRIHSLRATARQRARELAALLWPTGLVAVLETRARRAARPRLVALRAQANAVLTRSALPFEPLQQAAFTISLALLMVTAAATTPAFPVRPAHSTDIASRARLAPAGDASPPRPSAAPVSPRRLLLPRDTPRSFQDALPGLLGFVTASTPTPDTTRLVDAAPSPHYSNDHTIIALGLGATCSCPTLFRSRDGGYSWETAPGPPPPFDGVDQIALPPDYPRDSRIFLASSASGPGDVMAAAFGDAFTPLVGVPAGHLAPAGGFDGDDPSLYVAAASGLWRYQMSPASLDLVAATDPQGSAVNLSTAYGDAGVIVTAPAHTVVRTAVATWSAPLVSAALLRCGAPRGAFCASLAAFDGSSTPALTVSAGYVNDRTLVVYSPDRIELSTDGGLDLQAIRPPPSTPAYHLSLAAAPGSDTLLWAAGWQGARARLAVTPIAAVAWRDASSADPLFNAGPGLVVPVDHNRALYLVRAEGLRCTVNSGRSWLPSCPAA